MHTALRACVLVLGLQGCCALTVDEWNGLAGTWPPVFYGTVCSGLIAAVGSPRLRRAIGDWYHTVGRWEAVPGTRYVVVAGC